MIHCKFVIVNYSSSSHWNHRWQYSVKKKQGKNKNINWCYVTLSHITKIRGNIKKTLFLYTMREVQFAFIVTSLYIWGAIKENIEKVERKNAAYRIPHLDFFYFSAPHYTYLHVTYITYTRAKKSDASIIYRELLRKVHIENEEEGVLLLHARFLICPFQHIIRERSRKKRICKYRVIACLHISFKICVLAWGYLTKKVKRNFS